MNIPGYDSWKLATPPEYDELGLEPEDEEPEPEPEHPYEPQDFLKLGLGEDV